MIESLPDHLRERVRRQSATMVTRVEKPSFVIYWMRTAVRADENPALDVARWLADQERMPLLIYHAVSDRYAFASDRHHTFMLQGAQDVQEQFEDLGLSYAFHLATSTDQRPHLASLANEASVVVTEEMPVDPSRRFLKTLLRSTDTPVLTVDTACNAPMQLLKQPYTRAFQFRSATKQLFAERLARGWTEVEFETRPFDLSALPFDPLDLRNENIASLVANCQIDHAVGPVVDTIGGSAAGYRRWNQFKQHRLARYAKQRNNALLDGVSRMSAYLHYGMVSPFRIARETAAINNAGAQKYLDELLIWRELAYAFCFHRPDHDRLSALPDWARETLQRHASDPRGEIYSWERLARGETHDDFWNAAQRSLSMQGELHNNVRMTWGKAILNWTRSPREALAMMIDLNHRYALDGRDPASYGGILWCLGQFDRPFEPERPVFGSVRARPTEQHAQRLDTASYHAKVTEPRFDPRPHVAVIGAGMSGLFAARTLVDHGLEVTVFEKSRGVGGRMATRREEGGLAFDHGAQYFTARDPRFRRYVASWKQDGIVASWPDPSRGAEQRIVALKNGEILSESNSVDRFVGVPRMNSICRHLAGELDVRTQIRIAVAQPCDEGIELFDEAQQSLGSFDRLIVAIPAGQAFELLRGFPELAEQIGHVKMNPCWATMAAFEHQLTDQWVGAFVQDSFLSWVARNSTKPGRDQSSEQLILHAAPDWTAEHWERDAEEVASEMLDEFWRVSSLTARRPIHRRAHRWGFAIAENPSEHGCFRDASGRIAVCGDWASGSRVEGAFLSGMDAAGQMLRSLCGLTDSYTVQRSLF